METRVNPRMMRHMQEHTQFERGYSSESATKSPDNKEEANESGTAHKYSEINMAMNVHKGGIEHIPWVGEPRPMKGQGILLLDIKMSETRNCAYPKCCNFTLSR